MLFFAIIRDYIVWHYTRAYVDLLYVWKNYFWLIGHFFSVPELLRSWLAPFKRLEEKRVSIMKSPEDFFANLFVNLMMRIVGALLRTTLLCAAAISCVILLLLGLLVVLSWTVLPLVVVNFLLSSVRIFFI